MTTLPGEKQLTASILVIAQTQPSRVLLIHHKKHGTWIQSGGHVEKHENPLETALRELQEETGLDVSAYLQPGPRIDPMAQLLPLPDHTAEYVIPAHGDEPAHFHVDWLYVVRLPEMVELTNEERSAHDLGWFTLKEALELPMFENTKDLVRRFI